MRSAYSTCAEAADAYGRSGDLVAGANIVGFTRVAEAMLALGLI
jgi:glutamate dehydrogenase (NADP+)